MVFVRPQKSILFCLAAASLYACGGGGGGDASLAPTSQSAPPVIASSCTVGARSSANADSGYEVNAYMPDPTKVEAMQAKLTASPFGSSTRPVVKWIDLGVPDEQKVVPQSKAQQSYVPAAPLKVGFTRDVAATKNSDSTRQVVKWLPASSGGLRTTLGFQSQGAKGTRVGLLVESLPPQSIVRFYAPAAGTESAVGGQEILDTVTRNAVTGDTTQQGRIYWGPYLAGQRGVIEIELPAGIDPASVEIAVPHVSHFFIDPGGEEAIAASETGGAKAAGACNVDVACSVPLPVVSNSIAYLTFMEGGSAFRCTGTLVNDADSSGTPYFLTANHCVSNQTAASTITTGWFYRAGACNTGVANSARKEVAGGATLLYTVGALSPAANPVGTDTTLLRLNNPPPPGALFAGWTSIPQTLSGIDYFGLHHPGPDLQKISRGRITSFAYIDSAESARVSASTPNWPMYAVTWSSGTTEAGSSGSSLFLDALSANPKIVGQLQGGGASCQNLTAPDFYGRFDIAYNAALKRWLNPASKSCQ